MYGVKSPAQNDGGRGCEGDCYATQPEGCYRQRCSGADAGSLDQTNESDASFLMKLARQYGAIASVKDSNLLFIRQGRENGQR